MKSFKKSVLLRFGLTLVLMLTVAVLLVSCTEQAPDTASDTTLTISQTDTPSGFAFDPAVRAYVEQLNQKAGVEQGLTWEAIPETDAPLSLTSDYTIICAGDNTDSQLAVANAVQKAILHVTGIKLKIGFSDANADKLLIVGFDPDRPECMRAYESMGTGDGVVYIDGSKIVLGAYSYERMQQLAELLENGLVTKDQAGSGFSLMGGLLRGADSKETNLIYYRIIYSESYLSYGKSLALSLQSHIREAHCITLPVLSAQSSQPSDFEIVIGPAVNRAVPAAAVSDTLKPYEWQVDRVGDRVYLFGGAPFAIYGALEVLCQDKVFQLPEKTLNGSFIDTKDIAEKADGADVRIMSYNLLNESWSNVVSNVPVAGRAERFASMMLYYQPDVAGIQEISSLWHSYIQNILVTPGYYEKACARTASGKENMTTFLYNPKTVKLVDSYVLDIDSGSNIRVFSVAVFEKLSDGTRFVVTNTHPTTSNKDDYLTHIRTVVTLGNETIEKYKDLPVIMTGDFNASESSQGYPILTAGLPVRDAKFCAKELVRKYRSFLSPQWGGTVAADPNGTGSFDHIFITSQITPLRFNTVIDNQVEKTSDHLPIYADLKLS